MIIPNISGYMGPLRATPTFAVCRSSIPAGGRHSPQTFSMPMANFSLSIALMKLALRANHQFRSGSHLTRANASTTVCCLNSKNWIASTALISRCILSALKAHLSPDRRSIRISLAIRKFRYFVDVTIDAVIPDTRNDPFGNRHG